MATTLRGPVIARDPSTITVDQIKSARFTTTFRGYDAGEVKLHLDAVAAAFRQRLETETELRAIINGTQSPAEEPPFVAGVRTIDMRTEGVVIVDAERASTSDDETVAAEADLLADARRGAEEILAAARNEANALVARANDDAARIILRARAESRGRPTADGNAVVEAALNDSNGDPLLAREQARMMIEEAKVVRERILTDLSKRRRVAHVQLEQMRVAREKLVESLREARRLVDDASRDLSTADVEARIAADAAGRRVNSEPLPTAAELEMDLLASRYLVSSVHSGDLIPAPVIDGIACVDAEVEVVDAGTVADAVVPIEVILPDFGTAGAADATDEALLGAEIVRIVDLTATETAGSEHESAEADAQTGAQRLKPNVEELFARLRREREEAAQAARATLGSPVLLQEQSATVIDLNAYSGTTTTADERADPRGAKSSKKRGKNKSATSATSEPAETAPSNVLPDADRVINLSDSQHSASTLSGSEQAQRADAELDHETQLAYVLGPLREQMVRSVKRVLQDEQSVVLTALRTSRTRNDLDQLVGTTEVHPQKFYAVVEPALLRAFRAGVDRQGVAREDLGIDLSDDIGIAEDPAVHAETIGVSRAIVDVLRSQLGNELDRVASPEADSSMLISLMSNHYRAWNTERLAELVEPALRTVYRAGTSATTSS